MVAQGALEASAAGALLADPDPSFSKVGGYFLALHQWMLRTLAGSSCGMVVLLTPLAFRQLPLAWSIQASHPTTPTLRVAYSNRP